MEREGQIHEERVTKVKLEQDIIIMEKKQEKLIKAYKFVQAELATVKKSIKNSSTT